jgi:ABC-type Fe3+-hydroxamate transport system substrate-binding protein
MKDQLNRVLHLEKIPKRIVCLVPSQTELLCDLGLKPFIVGVTKFCVHPSDIKSKAQVLGGTKQINFDTLKALQPDIILCNKEENTKAIVDVCETICPVHVSDVFDLNDSYKLIEQYGTLFKVEQIAAAIITKIQYEFEAFQSYIKNKPYLNTLYFIWKSPWMIAGQNTFINYLLALNKFENYTKVTRYPEIELKQDENIALVLLSSEPYPFKSNHIREVEVFYPKANILLVDGEMFSWYGSRLTKAFNYFKALHARL